MTGSSELFFFNSSYKSDTSNKATRRFKIWVSFADKYIFI